ncbi:DUF4013 domain-containing protein [Methanobrevibacter sp.]|uniref:DUF4013 domain-containing protein n=1 Tax=Methanobrevibacter sp. TaxID=66852 RepID=UPI00388CF56D
MPAYTLKKVWEYCSYNIPFFVFITILIFIINLISDFSVRDPGWEVGFIISVSISVILTGYGLSITRDRINHGHRLPKIMPKDVLDLGIKGSFVYMVFFLFQGIILTFISHPLNFPAFNLEEMLLDFNKTIYLLFNHNPLHTIIFLIVGGMVFYITSFFGEVALARLADTKSIMAAFDLKAIYRIIDLFGWRHYARDYTSIIVVIVILTFIESHLPVVYGIDDFVGMFLGLLIFAAQYLGIGAVYCNIKDKELGRNRAEQ